MKIFIQALGINNSMGNQGDEVFASLFGKLHSTTQEITLASGRTTWICKVDAALPEIPEHLKKYDSRNNRLLLHAILQIQNQIDQALSRFGRNRVGIVLGTSTSGIFESEKEFNKPEGERFGGSFHYYRQEISNASDFLAQYLKTTAFSYTISTACTSSAKAFIEAKRLIASGACDAVIVGGVDTLSSLTVEGFDCLDSVAPKKTNPFSKNRNGINIGEGAAIFLVSKDEAEVEFAGYGESSDAYHISSPDPEGMGAEMAIRQAMAMAKLSAKDIGYINLHGTGTRKNDSMESKVVDRIFGSSPFVSTTKPMIGHTLGAAGAQEAALCYLTLQKRNTKKQMPVQLWDGEQDDELPNLNFVRPESVLARSICMSNSFAFGGNNVSLIFRGLA